MKRISQAGRHIIWMCVFMGLVLVLILSACGTTPTATGANSLYSGTQQNQTTTSNSGQGSTGSTGQSSNASQVQQMDQQVQQMLQSLDSARNDTHASENAAAQDNTQVP